MRGLCLSPSFFLPRVMSKLRALLSGVISASNVASNSFSAGFGSNGSKLRSSCLSVGKTA